MNATAITNTKIASALVFPIKINDPAPIHPIVREMMNLVLSFSLSIRNEPGIKVPAITAVKAAYSGETVSSLKFTNAIASFVMSYGMPSK